MSATGALLSQIEDNNRARPNIELVNVCFLDEPKLSRNLIPAVCALMSTRPSLVGFALVRVLLLSAKHLILAAK
jgi:hypothetical protein